MESKAVKLRVIDLFLPNDHLKPTRQFEASDKHKHIVSSFNSFIGVSLSKTRRAVEEGGNIKVCLFLCSMLP